ncbi:MAG: FixH family protein [Thiobacillus sp.]|nr:FixH family protein [Thiobacillus sp.]
MKHPYLFSFFLAASAALLPAASTLAQTPGTVENTPFDNIRSATWDTDDGRYSVHLDEVPAVLKSGELQSWCVRVTDARGKPARNIKLRFTGGMPQHGHGLPSVPATSAGKGKCPYRIDGIEFHMPGVWQIGFDIVGRDGRRQEIRRFVNVN